MTNAQMAPATGSPWSFGLSDRLAKALSVSGVSNAEMAARLGVSTNTVGNYTSGRTAPRPPVIQSWADATGAPLEWLLTGSEPTGPGRATGGSRGPRGIYLLEVGPAVLETATSTVESEHLAEVVQLFPAA